MLTNIGRPIGFRSTQPWGNDPHGTGWRAWVGPLLLARTRGTRFGWQRGEPDIPTWWQVSLLGVTLGWYR